MALSRSFEKNPLRLSEKAVDRLLNDLCLTLGICLPPDDYEQFVANPPTSPRKFAEAVLEAECGSAGDLTIFDPVFDMVLKAFLHASEYGALQDDEADGH